MKITHEPSCDREMLGWMVENLARLESRAAFTADTLIGLRDDLRERGLLPKCECARRRVKRLTRQINTARKSGDERYENLLAERRELSRTLDARREDHRVAAE